MKNLAIIPARCGSKGLRDKNIKPLAGIPLIAHTIICARDSGMFDEIFVSTDSMHYADIALKYGASVPFLRDKALATDTASSWDVVRSAVTKYEELGTHFDTICLLQPTSPLRIPDDIVNGYLLLKEKDANAIVAVSEADHSPLWCNMLDESLSLEGFISKELLSKGRQQIDKYYRINGALYIVRTDLITSDINLYTKGCYAHVMPKERAIDIDDEFDFIIAEHIYYKIGG